MIYDRLTCCSTVKYGGIIYTTTYRLVCVCVSKDEKFETSTRKIENKTYSSKSFTLNMIASNNRSSGFSKFLSIISLKFWKKCFTRLIPGDNETVGWESSTFDRLLVVSDFTTFKPTAATSHNLSPYTITPAQNFLLFLFKIGSAQMATKQMDPLI